MVGKNNFTFKSRNNTYRNDKSNYKVFNGYIEGYYGRLLSWNERIRIISGLKKNQMNLKFVVLICRRALAK